MLRARTRAVRKKSAPATNRVGLVLGIAGLIVAAGFSAQAVIGAPRPTRTLRFEEATATIPVGRTHSEIVGCPSGYWPISGSYGLIEGSRVYILTNGISGNTYRFGAWVPNRLQAPGAVTASFKLRVLCAQAGKPLVP